MKTCEGCLGVTYDCFYIEYTKKFKCPCFMCLVKVVCNVGCDEFEAFASKCIKIRVARERLRSEEKRKNIRRGFKL